jgi:transposase
MDELFAIDEKARKENLHPSDRHLLRLEKARPLLEQIKTAIQAARGDALAKSALAKACHTLTLLQRLIRFLDYPVVELSNNLAENAAIPVGADCGHVYHHALPRHHLGPAELFEML